MDTDDAPDLTLSAWTAKPPPRQKSSSPRVNGQAQPASESDGSRQSASEAPSERSSSAGNVHFDGTRVKKTSKRRSVQEADNDEDEDNDVVEVRRNDFAIHIPRVSRKARRQYQPVSGRDLRVSEVLSETQSGFMVKLTNGGTEKVRFRVSYYSLLPQWMCQSERGRIFVHSLNAKQTKCYISLHLNLCLLNVPFFLSNSACCRKFANLSFLFRSLKTSSAASSSDLRH